VQRIEPGFDRSEERRVVERRPGDEAASQLDAQPGTDDLQLWQFGHAKA
jgi:hypothetical protein